jgi:hypothetical protein
MRLSAYRFDPKKQRIETHAFLDSIQFGMAPLYSLIHKPKLFQAHITMSPWITDKSGLVVTLKQS